MTPEEFKGRVTDLTVTVGMNQRYHQAEAHRWWLFDVIAKIVTAVFAVGGMSLAIVVAFDSHNELVHIVEIVVALVAAVGAIILNVVPFAEWQHESKQFLGKWTRLMKRLIPLARSDAFSAENEGRLVETELEAEEINGEECPAKPKLLEKCLQAEEKSRGIEAKAKAA